MQFNCIAANLFSIGWTIANLSVKGTAFNEFQCAAVVVTAVLCASAGSAEGAHLQQGRWSMC